MNRFKEKLFSRADQVRQSFEKPDRREAIKWAVGSAAVVLMAESTARGIPNNKLGGRIARTGLRTVALGAFGAFARQTMRVGELKDRPKPTSIELSRERLDGFDTLVLENIDSVNRCAAEADKMLTDYKKSQHLATANGKAERALGMVLAGDELNVPPPNGYTSYQDLFSRECEVKPIYRRR